MKLLLPSGKRLVHRLGSTQRFTLVCLLFFQGLVSFSQIQNSDSVAKSYTVPIPSKNEEVDVKDRPGNNIFLNLLGDGSLASLNYERLIFIHPKLLFLSAGVGVGANSLVTLHSNEGFSFSNDIYLTIPHHVTANIGYGRHFLEVGLGGAGLTGPRLLPYLPYALVGYRLQPWRVRRLHFRLFLSYPLESIDKFDIIFVPVGISGGWSF